MRKGAFGGEGPIFEVGVSTHQEGVNTRLQWRIQEFPDGVLQSQKGTNL